MRKSTRNSSYALPMMMARLNGCVLEDDLAPYPDDGPGHMHSGRVPAHDSREGGGSANVDGGPHERARPGGDVGALCQSHAGKRKAAPAEGIDKLRHCLMPC